MVSLMEILYRHPIATTAGVGLATFGAAFYRGYLDSRGVPPTNGNTFLIVALPALFSQGVVLSTSGFYEIAEKKLNVPISKFKRFAFGTLMGGLELTLGYTAGYGVGKLTA